MSHGHGHSHGLSNVSICHQIELALIKALNNDGRQSFWLEFDPAYGRSNNNF
jgi:hypothetical protein